MVHLEEFESSFWGLTLENEKRYSQTVKTSFHISMAALEPQTDNKKSDPVCVMIQSNDAEFLLCTLSSQILQQPLDLNFRESEEITFFLSGKGRVHLTGYVVPEEPEEVEEDSEEEDSEELESDPGSDEDIPRLQALEESSDSDSDDDTAAPGGKRKKKQDKGEVKKRLVMEEAEEADSDDSDFEDGDDENDIMDINELLAAVDESDDDDDDDDEEEEEDDEEEDDEDEEESEDDDESGEDTEGSFIAKPQKQKKGEKQKAEKSSPKKELEAKSQPESEKKKKKKNKKNKENHAPVEATPNQTSQSEAETPSTDKKKKRKRKKNKNKDNAEQTPNKQEKGNVDTPKSAGKSPKPKKMTLQGGIIAEEVKEGHGPTATPGKMTAVHYVGKLMSNNKEFDRTRGTPFKFKLGKGEVIKGWDIGVKGMKVGGKRRLTIPAKMAYGKQRAGEIPPNSTLVFDVELKSVS